MARPRLSLGVSFLFFAPFAVAQQNAIAPPASSPPVTTQGTAALQKALAALAPSAPISDVTLTGTARRIAGADDESGTVVLKGLAGTGTRLELALSSGPRTEIRNSSPAAIAGSWSGPDGLSHAVAYHNSLADPAWFPALTIRDLLAAPNEVVSYVGAETHDGQSVIHIKASQPLPASLAAPKDVAALVQHLTEVDVFVDAATGLPVAITFNTHPDNYANLDIPVEIRFSDYRAVNGAQIPFHVQKFLNDSLFLDLRFETAALNSGLDASAFTVGTTL